MTEHVHCEYTRDERVAEITLHRPDKLNAIDDSIAEELPPVLSRVEQNPDVRVVVFTGAGGNFCVGGDIDRMKRRHDTDMPATEYRRSLGTQHQKIGVRLFELDKPVIGVVEGQALGAGANLALTCDIVLAAETATFGWVFQDMAMGVDFGGSFLLPQLVGIRRAKELLFKSETLSGAQAAEEGLITDAVPPSDLECAVEEWIEHLIDAPTEAIAVAKEQVHYGAVNTFTSAIDHETFVQALLYTSADHEEAVSAFLEDRTPDFSGN